MNSDTSPITTPGVLITGDDAKLTAVRSLARIMETAVEIPGTKIRVGLDAIVGLIPGVGDVVGSAIGGYILMIASQLGVPRVVLWRMLGNLAIDAVVGAVPFLGDILDVAWKANTKNVKLLEQAVADPQSAKRQSTWGLVLMGLIVLLIGAAGAGLTWFLIWLIVK